tara:strand:+ start:7347 stop:7526 length:180 start_codon:yes stop_codon:yes gene_type:complete
MELINVLFVICWIFSLILFYLGGFAHCSALAHKAKQTLIQEGKALISELLGKADDESNG